MTPKLSIYGLYAPPMKSWCHMRVNSTSFARWWDVKYTSYLTKLTTCATNVPHPILNMASKGPYLFPAP